jgi:cellulose biosynthesis protein BcsQ
MKKRVLLIDLDPQANATIVGINKEELDKFFEIEKKKSIADLFINCYKNYGPFPKKEAGNININGIYSGFFTFTPLT